MFEQSFKNIDDILHKDSGCTSERGYTEQSMFRTAVALIREKGLVPDGTAKYAGRQRSLL